MLSKSIYLALFLFSSSLAFSAAQASLSLAFDSLPSAQGWLEPGSLNYSETYSVANNLLTGNSIDQGTGAGVYLLNDIIDPNEPWSLSWSVNLIDYYGPENHAAMGHGGLTVLANVDGIDVGVQYGLNYVGGVVMGRSVALLEESGTQFIPLETFGSFRNYLLEFTPGLNAGLGAWYFSVDSSLISTGTGRIQNRPSVNLLAFGDGATGANAHWQISEFTFTQAVAGTLVGVSLPGAIWHLILGLAGLLGFFRARFIA